MDAAGLSASAETVPPSSTPVLEPGLAAQQVADLGFVANPDLPDRPGPAYLVVALRATPTLRHYDPEAVEYWVTRAGRGERRVLSRGTPVPFSEDFSWGMVRLVDRLQVSNEYLTFGGRVDAGLCADAVVAAFTSPAPLLRRGGHSQSWDAGADAVGAFFGRLMVAVDFTPGFESTLAAASPVTRYAAFIHDAVDRRQTGRRTESDGDVDRLLRSEAHRLQEAWPAEWAGGKRLLAEAHRP